MENDRTVDPTSICQLFYQENLKISLKSINILRNSRFLNIDVCSKIMHFGSNSIVLVWGWTLGTLFSSEHLSIAGWHPWHMTVIHDSPWQPDQDCKPFSACFSICRITTPGVYSFKAIFSERVFHFWRRRCFMVL